MICAGNLEIGNSVIISGDVYISDVLHNYKDGSIMKQDLVVERTRIGDNCFIGYGAVILPGVILGKWCIVGADSVVLKGDYPDYCILAGTPAKIFKKLDGNSRMREKVEKASR